MRPLPVASRLAAALAAVRAWWRGRSVALEPGGPLLERPWLRTWNHLPKRSAGADFTRADYAAARARAREVARATLGRPSGHSCSVRAISTCPLRFSLV